MTSRQIQAAARGSVYVWGSEHVEYPRELARRLGREDVRIVTPDWIRREAWRGMEMTGLEKDHAAVLDNEEWKAFLRAMLMVRPASP